jgi:hypothetical protein
MKLLSLTARVSLRSPRRTNNEPADYSDESEHPIPAKVDSRFDDDFLG